MRGQPLIPEDDTDPQTTAGREVGREPWFRVEPLRFSHNIRCDACYQRDARHEMLAQVYGSRPVAHYVCDGCLSVAATALGLDSEPVMAPAGKGEGETA